MSPTIFQPTTYQPPIIRPTFKHLETKDKFSIHELPLELNIKPNPTPLPSNDTLRDSLKRSTSPSKVSKTLNHAVEEDDSLLESDLKERDSTEAPSERTTTDATRDEAITEGVHLSKRERWSQWWRKERAEQKAFGNAMAPYFAF